LPSEPSVTLDCGERFAATGLPTEHTCPECPSPVSVSKEGRLTEGGAVRACLACGCDRLWVEKDLSLPAGCMIFLVGAAVSVVLFILGYNEEAIAFLLGVVLVDVIMYLLAGRRSVCYRCEAKHRGFPLNPDHRGYEHGIGEKLSDRDDQSDPA
jgi:hypothetical protein